jgi:hypothetical protein
MHKGAQAGSKNRSEAILEAEIIAALSRPVSPRELFAVVGDTLAVMRAFNRLVSSGRVERWGARNTFDHGHEMLYVRGRAADRLAVR